MIPSWHNGPEYEFCGYTYGYDIMDDGDVRKIWHEIYDPRNTIVKCRETSKWFSYHFPTKDEFETAVVDHMLQVYLKSNKEDPHA